MGLRAQEAPFFCMDMRFFIGLRSTDEELIELLKETQWWDLPIEEIQTLIPILTSPDLEGLKAELKKRKGVKQ